MFRSVIFMILIGNALSHFLHKRHHHHHHHQHFTIDMDGFHGHGYQSGFMFNTNKKPFGPPPVYGPPPPFPLPFPHHAHNPNFGDFQHGQQHGHQHGYQHYDQSNGVGFHPTNMMPFNSMQWGPNFPFNLFQNVYNNPFPNNPNQFVGAVPPTIQPNLFDASRPTTPTPMPSNIVPNGETNSNPTKLFEPADGLVISIKPSVEKEFGTETNADNRPIDSIPNENSGSTEATVPFPENPKIDQNNGNNYNEADAIVPNNNNFDINSQPVTVPNVSEPTSDASSTQGKDELEYDIDIRFGDNRPNQKPPVPS